MVSGCNANWDKTRCIPLGKAKHDLQLLSLLSGKYGKDFVSNEFTALGVNFDNSRSLQDISDSNFLEKLNKAKLRAEYWKSRDLTIYGRVTIIKSILLAQFVYVIIPLLRPSGRILNEITTFVFNFLWGSKRDKLKRDLVTQKREKGGLAMFYPCDFILGLKLKILQKIGDINFSHSWKDIVLSQVKFPEHPGICFENSLISPTFTFTHQLINCYIEWKQTASKNLNACINHCVWGNSSITDIGSKLWNLKLIDNNINYLTEFVNKEGEVMSYKEFCCTSLLGNRHIITNREYVDLKMAIRRFSNSNVPHRNLNNINSNLSLKFFINHTASQLKGYKIRDVMSKNISFDKILPLDTWRTAMGLEKSDIDWPHIFKNLYSGFTRNYKLIQFQYKLLLRISTCRYMRHKMKIDTTSPVCFHCNLELETLDHIFLKCPKTTIIYEFIESCIKVRIQENYIDTHKTYYVTCSHENPIINYLWAASKYYISSKFQKQKCLSAIGLKNYILAILHGESEAHQQAIKLALDSN